MFALLTGFSAVNYSTRFALPQIIEAISEDIGLPPEQKATLLGAFFPIYIALMVPGGWLAKTWGPKLCVTADCGLQAAALLLQLP